MPWNTTNIKAYQQYAKSYISSFNARIDCADLAIAALVDFAAKETLPVKLKYYSSGWQWMEFDPNTMETMKFKQTAMRQLGALNIIDNTKPIQIGLAKSGDLIMSKWSPTLGHTRIIYSVKYDAKNKKFEVIWYQGNLPPVKPEKKTEYFSNVSGIYGGTPRRWKFEQFNK
ncbi:MAG: hypothetical protein ABFS39_11445 [Pseudomonadota bacterium]